MNSYFELTDKGEESGRFSQKFGLHPKFAVLALEFRQPGPFRLGQRLVLNRVFIAVAVYPIRQRAFMHPQLASDLHDGGCSSAPT